MSSSPSSAEACDIAIVGGGGAALTAAADAAARGCQIVVLEKAARLGGTTALSVGSLMASGTRMQARVGIADSVDRHEADVLALLAAAGMNDNPHLRRLLLENAGATVDFLESIGVDFIGPLVQPGFTVNRFYQALPGGRAYIARLAAHCRKLGVAIRVNTRVTQLVKTGARVSGVVLDTPVGPRILAARRGVILASGDLSADHATRSRLWGPELAALAPLNPASTGDGQRMGVAAGGVLVTRPDLVPHATPRFALSAHPGLIAHLPAWRVLTRAMKLAFHVLPAALTRPFVMKAAMTALAPERALYEAGAILVNRAGERFTDETKPIGAAIARQPGGESYVVFDGRVAAQFSVWPHFVSTAPGIAYAYVADYRSARPDLYHQGKTLADLARALGCSAATFEVAFRARNGPGTAPFIALGPLKTWLLLTQVGLAVNTRLQVLDEKGAPIPGLYAAGGVGQGGLSCTSYHHGHSLAWAFTSGRLAAQSAAADDGG